MNIKIKQKLAKDWFIKLQKIICQNIEKIEKKHGSDKVFKKKKMETWRIQNYKG